MVTIHSWMTINFLDDLRDNLPLDHNIDTDSDKIQANID